MEQELLVAIPEAVANLTKLEKCGIIRKRKNYMMLRLTSSVDVDRCSFLYTCTFHCYKHRF